MSKSIRIKDDTYSRLKVLSTFDDEAKSVDDLISQAVDSSDIHLISTVIIACLKHLNGIKDPKRRDREFSRGMMAMMPKFYTDELIDKAIAYLEDSWSVIGGGYKVTYDNTSTSNTVVFFYEPIADSLER